MGVKEKMRLQTKRDWMLLDVVIKFDDWSVGDGGEHISVVCWGQ